MLVASQDAAAEEPVRQPKMAVLATVVLLLVSACGSSPATQAPATSQAPGPSQAPGSVQASTEATQLPADVVGVTGHECDAIPTFDISDPVVPSFPPDAQLEQHFPPTIDGNPVTNVSSLSWVAVVCMFGGGQAALQQSRASLRNLPLAQMSFGSANAIVDGDSVGLSAVRIPGQDASQFTQYLDTLATLSSQVDLSGSVAERSISGKNVFVYTDSDGNNAYVVPLGDTLVFFDGVTAGEARKTIAALQ